MKTMRMTAGFELREHSRRLPGLAHVIGLHVVVLWLLASGLGRKGMELIRKPMEAVVIQEVILPPPAPPPPKELPRPDPLTPRSDSAPPPVVPELPAPTAAPTAALPVKEIAVPQVAQPLPPVAAPVDAGKPQAASLEAEYLGKVRAMLNSTKRYPTGRQASQTRPQGRVKVWFTLSRQGALLDAGVLESSNSNLLDDAALATVRRGSYPPFPADTWPAQEQHKFSAEIEFKPPSAD